MKNRKLITPLCTVHATVSRASTTHQLIDKTSASFSIVIITMLPISLINTVVLELRYSFAVRNDAAYIAAVGRKICGFTIIISGQTLKKPAKTFLLVLKPHRVGKF